MVKIQNNFFIQPAELNAFVYCRRQWYYRYILKITIKDENMRIGVYLNDTHWQNAKKRKEKVYYSEKYKLKGRIDYIESEDGLHIPLEIKKGRSNKGDAWEWDIMQLICYIHLLDEFYLNEEINYGYILYKQSRERIKVLLTKRLEGKWQIYVREIRYYKFSKNIPRRRKHKNSRGKCALYEYCLI